MWAVFLLGGGLFSIWLDLRWFPEIASNALFHIISFALGLVVMRAVMRASRNTGRLLARFGKEGEVPRFETNKLVMTGVYSCMRHPMHFGLLFFPFAFAFILGSPTFIILVAPAEAALMTLLVKFVEEPQAIRKFGSEYRSYMKDVPFFSVTGKCLKQLLGKGEF